MGGRQVLDGVQTDAPINHGNSRGSPIDMDAKVIGIIGACRTAKCAGELSFAIPINEAKGVAVADANKLVVAVRRLTIGQPAPIEATIMDENRVPSLWATDSRPLCEERGALHQLVNAL